MKKILLLLLAIAPMWVTAQTTSPSGRQTIKTYSGKRYWEYLPPGYSTATGKKYTVVVFFHGQGERGSYATGANVYNEMLKVFLAHTPPAQAESFDFPFILISPQLQDTQNSWYPGFVDAMVNLARDTTKYKVDVNNVYLTGFSLGGGAVWEKGLSSTNAPKIRGLAPVAGSGNNIPNACNVVTYNHRVWAFHGSLDPTINVSVTQNMIAAINNCSPAPAIAPKMTIYEGKDHFTNDEAFMLNNDLHLPNLYQWIMESNPRTPIANAGTDKVVTLPTTTLTITGSGSDSDGTISTYTWTQVSGAAVTMSGANTATLQLSNLAEGEYVFRLQVKDNMNWPSTPDDVKVTVVTPPNQLPVVSLGPDKVIQPASATYTPSLTGNATDADGTIASYAWTKISGGQVTLVNADTKTVSLANIIPGQYVFRLTATDNNGGQGYDEINVRVNAKPIPNAGPDITITLPQNSVQITGTATDPDGTVVSYKWEQYSGAATTMSGTDTQTLTLTNLVAGSYGYRFIATDNDGSSDRDYITVTVKAATNASARMATADSESKPNDSPETAQRECADCSITLYNTQGTILFKGSNDYETYRSMISENRLFYYVLWKDNKTVKTGKLLIKP